MGIEVLAEHLQKSLQSGKRVLWFVSGGSNIQASVQVMNKLTDEPTENLAIFLIDERFGAPGHKDSNYKQFQDAGFQHKQASFIPVLVEGLNLQETSQRYSELLERALDHADIVIGQIGIGADGHIAGILPHTSATAASGLVISYEHPTHTRITATFDAIRRIDCDFSFVFGKDKYEALYRLKTEDLPLQEQPSQILKELKEVHIYNDQIGEEST